MIELQNKIINYSIPEPNTGCWLWNRCLGKDNYGLSVHNKKTIGAHRLSYIAFKGKIINNLYVLHKCDTPSCVNPEHLFLGTAKDNAIDASKKGKYNNMPQSFKRKVLCKRGHELNDLTTHLFFRKDRNTYERYCRKCKNIVTGLNSKKKRLKK